MGFGSASLKECLKRIGAQPRTTIPATCASGEGSKDSSLSTNPRQVMSPKPDRTFPQDPFHVQEAPRVDVYLRPDEPSNKCKEEETSASEPKREEYDIKEEPESPGLREGVAAHPSQPSQLPPERSTDPARATYYQDTSSGPSEAPWVYVMSELRSVQFAWEQLRTRMDGVEVSPDVIGLRENQDNLSNRVRRFEESVGLHHVNESLNRIIRVEASVGHAQVSESLRECQVGIEPVVLLTLQDSKID